MSDWRRFERERNGKVEFWEIRQEGIRCFLGWGTSPGRGRASTSTLTSEQHAREHLESKVKERLRKGFAEVEGSPGPVEDPDALVVDAYVERGTSPATGLAPPVYAPVPGLDDVVCEEPRGKGSAFAHYRYLVLSDHGRRAICMSVLASSHREDLVRPFLEFLVTVRALPFDGNSHHKLTLPRPVGPFSHALLCSPALGCAARAMPAIAPRVASAFPIYDCEIGDQDAAVLVDARIVGHGCIPRTDWDRAPRPVCDLRFPTSRRELEFKVYEVDELRRRVAGLAKAEPGDWLEVRSFRGTVLRLTPDDAGTTTTEDAQRFLYSG